MLNSVKSQGVPCIQSTFLLPLFSENGCAMNKSNFRILSLMVVLSLVLLTVVETIWAVRTYQDMKSRYEQQMHSILEEAVWKYATPSMSGDATINIGNISRLHAFVGEGMRTASITTCYRVEVLSTTATEPVVIMATGDTMTDTKHIIVDKHIRPLIMRLIVEDPQAEIVANMRWILILQLLSVFLLSATFIFLLHTLFKAKEVDRIRRDLTHNITHELKTPIASAYAATEALRTMPTIAESEDTRNDYLDISLGELRRLSDMVEEILRNATEEFATAELRNEECQLKEMICSICDTYTLRYASRNVVWNIDIADNCAVVADSFHLKGALSAIIDNAIKYSPREPQVDIEATTKSGYTYISIKDNGIGIPRNQHKHIFEKFYRINDGHSYFTSGYGLGLYYVHGVIERHHGSISITSTYGEGTCLTIKLPRYGK